MAEAPRGRPAHQLALELPIACTFGACREGARPQESRLRSCEKVEGLARLHVLFQNDFLGCRSSSGNFQGG